MKFYQTLYIFLLLIPLFLSGCLDRPLSFQVRFDSISGLTQGNSVFFERNRIGKVTKITYTEQGDYLVQLAIEESFRNAATINSHFFTGTSPLSPNNQAVIIIQEQPGGKIIEHGSIVHGENSPSLLSEFARIISTTSGLTEEKIRKYLDDIRMSMQSVSKSIDKELEIILFDISHQLHIFQQRVQQAPIHEEIMRLQHLIELLGTKLENAERHVRVQIQKQILPDIQHNLKQLRKILEKNKQQNEIKEVDEMQQQIDTMMRI